MTSVNGPIGYPQPAGSAIRWSTTWARTWASCVFPG